MEYFSSAKNSIIKRGAQATTAVGAVALGVVVWQGKEFIEFCIDNPAFVGKVSVTYGAIALTRELTRDEKPRFFKTLITVGAIIGGITLASNFEDKGHRAEKEDTANSVLPAQDSTPPDGPARQTPSGANIDYHLRLPELANQYGCKDKEYVIQPDDNSVAGEGGIVARTQGYSGEQIGNIVQAAAQTSSNTNGPTKFSNFNIILPGKMLFQDCPPYIG